ncbi:UDP-N-acetylmuramoyl-L-alanyl-D-glutamate--2,6-diaminopimelate ligase [Wenzhouxiangella sp. XN201]|uniref:UDP-N-acetylmuramoyl-L-alanyl-D-glutamate--2, 6-diaminopimelate ligase n=1 Tax=Wenzhouxiangella sp. XN201 TaxID=2710755 RepID=UPI0013C580D0|nr:UDP-N-acetylmuramoyl-L-alanyl-D-glutamate--2,6-diaminopimelate ligase [Wenzhouxiangella sp. XN201]NEZ04747.1 UDP-N-acetylmuramoyl-L-alanyl-D-glutamate--2,6-diaminopimelate ligase [Wenzhouxiangella sp. XN201]
MTERWLSLNELLDGQGAAIGESDIRVCGLALDSRRLQPGDAFVALAGASQHGMAYVYEARQRGAAVVIHDGQRELPEDLGLPAVSVPELGSRLASLAARMWGEDVDRLDLVAVTGTNGKSSVAWLLAQALDGAMIGTLGWGRPARLEPASHTTPDVFSVYRLLASLSGQGVERVVMEASSHALDQGRLEGLCFASVIFTNLGHDHLDYHADRAAYAAAKARLFRDFDSGRQIVNLDDEFGAELAGELAGREHLISYSLTSGSGSDVSARVIAADRDGLALAFQLGECRFEARSRLIGRVNAWNLLIVAAELQARGLDGDEIARRLSALEPVPGRMEPVRSPGGPLAIVDYAHTPDALENALISARELTDEALWCVFGCGGDRDREKRPRMGRVAERLADHIVLTDDNPRHEDGLAIIRAIQAGMEKPQRSIVFRDRARAIAHALDHAGDGDVVLVAGKGHETEQVIGDRRLPFDDRQCVREKLEVAA